MNLEPITQNEVSQKWNKKYGTLMHIHIYIYIYIYIYMKSRKMVLMNLFSGQE